jgi:hypothetical protein
MPTAQQLYVSEVSVLPASEQLRLATLILEGLTESAAAVLDFSDHWSDEDMRDLVAFSLRHAGKTVGEE